MIPFFLMSDESFRKKPFTTIAIFIFSTISFLHLYRIYQKWEITVGGKIIPLWISLAGFIITGGLALMLWKEVRK